MTTHLFVQLAIIFGIYLGGEGIALLLPIPIPGNILGMLILFCCLLIKWVKMKHIESVGKFLLNNMAFFFIPAGVSIMESMESIQNDLFPILLVCILTTLITFIATAFAAKIMISLQEKRRNK